MADSINFMFIIQGEGRGHMTQALGLKTILENAGHHVCVSLVGQCGHRRVPAFFQEKIGMPISYFSSPTFALDDRERTVKMWATLTQNVKLSPVFKASLAHIESEIQKYKPDMVINFFEPLSGIFNMLHRPNTPFISVGHQYMFHHPGYPFPRGQHVQRLTAKSFTRLTSFGSKRLMALSFYPGVQQSPRLVVSPPILRERLFAQPLDQEDPFFLIYVINHGYAEAIIEWHKAHPDTRLECFWDNPEKEEVWKYHDNLTFHQLSDVKFLDMMATCAGLVCTAGFESIAEAMYLGKRILAVPVEGHVEQNWNATDLELFGGGIKSNTFSIDKLHLLERPAASFTQTFRSWVQQADRIFVKEFEKVMDEASRDRLASKTLA